MHEVSTTFAAIGGEELGDSADAARLADRPSWGSTQEALMRDHRVVDLMPIAAATVLFVLTLAVLWQHPPVGETGTASGRGAAESGVLR